MATTENMLGHGFYNQHAQEQGAANRFGLDLITQAVPNIELAQVGTTFRIADYGSAQGHNSLLPIKRVIETFRARGADAAKLPVSVTHTDLPTNDWTTLFETVLTDPNSYTAGTTNVFPFASGTSMYEQIFPPQQIAFGYSAIATHWLSHNPSALDGQIWSARATGTAHEVWAKQARDDWYAFLHDRCTELVPTGQLVMVNSGANAQGESGAEPLLDLVNSILQGLVKDGTLAADEYAAMAIPTYYRVEREWREPFADTTFLRDNPLQLLHYSELALADVALDRYTQTRDAEQFAQADAAFFRAAFQPALFSALGPSRTEESRAQLLAAFSQKLTAALAQTPEAYPARWVLQLMWVGKK